MQPSTRNALLYLKDRLYIGFGILLSVFWVISCYFSFNNPSNNYLIYLCALLFFILEMGTTNILIRRKLTGQVYIPRVYPRFNYNVFFIGITFLLQFIAGRYKVLFPFFIAFYVAAFTECVTWLLLKHYKAVGLIIDNDKLWLNNKTITKRNLENLTTITLNDMENVIILRFSNERRLKIIIKEFLREDLVLFINNVTNLSKNQVEVQPIVYKKLQPPPPPLPFFRKISKGFKDLLLP